MQEFLRELRDRNAHILDVVAAIDGRVVYYREYGSYATDVKVKFIRGGKMKNVKLLTLISGDGHEDKPSASSFDNNEFYIELQELPDGRFRLREFYPSAIEVKSGLWNYMGDRPVYEEVINKEKKELLIENHTKFLESVLKDSTREFFFDFPQWFKEDVL